MKGVGDVVELSAFAPSDRVVLIWSVVAYGAAAVLHAAKARDLKSSTMETLQDTSGVEIVRELPRTNAFAAAATKATWEKLFAAHEELLASESLHVAVNKRARIANAVDAS